MKEWGHIVTDVASRGRADAVFFEGVRGSGKGPRVCLSRWADHRLAILVHQGSDPTLPYQALVIRESAMLFQGFAPWDRKAFSARQPGAARRGRGPLTLEIVPRRPRGAPTQSAKCRRAVEARDV